jgi:uncharacterized short protein YbdD (DUF466 family)
VSWENASESWQRCYECDRNFRRSDYLHHMKTAHVERPDPQAMTVYEVACALRITRRRAGYLITSRKLRSFRTTRGFAKRWVLRKDFMAYVREQVALHPEKAVEWAAAGALK